MKEFSSPAAASNWLKEGKILIHPTEGVWGLGCDASNINACEKISLLKQRTNNKSFILLAPSIPFALACTAEVAPSQIEFLESIWPGHITVIMQANESILSHIKTLDNRDPDELELQTLDINGDDTLIDLDIMELK